MKYSDIRDSIQKSHPSDWNSIPCWGSGSGPSYRVEWDKMTGAGSEWELRLKEHSHIAAYKPDLGVTLAWGMPAYDDKHPEMKPDWLDKFPLVNSVEYFLIDTFWNGSVIDRDYYTVVDSQAYLPLPTPLFGEPGIGSADSQLERHEVTHYQVALTRLVNNLDNHQDSNFDRTLDRTGFVVVDGISE